MKLLIAGSRTFNDYEELDYYISTVVLPAFPGVTTIISGMATGTDTLAVLYARQHNLELIERPADWKTYGKSAGYRRNKEMVELADVVVVFWDGKSRGTHLTIDLAQEKLKTGGLKAIFYNYTGTDIEHVI